MDDHVAIFINYLRAEKGFSQNTISAYQNDLSQLALVPGRVRGPR